MSQKRVHFEPYVYLPALTQEAAIIAWGGFYFEVKTEGQNEKWKLFEDEKIPDRDPARPGSIGLRSKLCGPEARVELVETQSGASRVVHVDGANHAVIRDLKPDTEYKYRVIVRDINGNDTEWGKGPLRDWNAATGKLEDFGKSYDNRFKTFPRTELDAPSLNFAVIGDFGRGVRKAAKQGDSRCQREIAEALERAVEQHDLRFLLTTGDNIYAKRVLLVIVSDSGDEDKDWFYTYFQPYRYIINRIPTFPAFGNHDEGETEEGDDRDQLYDNLYIREHFESLRDPNESVIDKGLCYRFNFGKEIEFICLDTSKDNIFAKRFFELPQNGPFLDRVLTPGGARWKIVYSHHPPYCAGPKHGSRPSLQKLMQERGHAAGVKVFLSGHEHNLQHSTDGITSYFITGGSGKFEGTAPNKSRFADAKTQCWGGDSEGHFLLVRIEGKRMKLSAIGMMRNDELKPIRVKDVNDGSHRDAEFTIEL